MGPKPETNDNLRAGSRRSEAELRRKRTTNRKKKTVAVVIIANIRVGKQTTLYRGKRRLSTG